MKLNSYENCPTNKVGCFNACQSNGFEMGFCLYKPCTHNNPNACFTSYCYCFHSNYGKCSNYGLPYRCLPRDCNWECKQKGYADGSCVPNGGNSNIYECFCCEQL